MAEIFLSYAREDRERIKVLVDWLQQQGWSVWWDRQIPPGKTFDQVIEAALNAARCVIVVWSKDSVGSEWVKNEAEEGLSRRILVPVLLDEVRPPLGFRRMQAASLIHWNGDPRNPELESLSHAIQDIIKQGPAKSTALPVAQERTAPTGNREFGVLQSTSWWDFRSRIKAGVIASFIIVGLIIVIIFVKQFGSRSNDPNTNVSISNANPTPSPLVMTPTVTPSPVIEVIFDNQTEIFNNGNTAEVQNNPRNPTRFTIDKPYYITRVNNYHWNNKQGKDPTGKYLTLRNEKGQDFAQCEFSSTSSAPGEAPNVNWICSPNVILQPGTYTVIDPDPQTWSHNEASGNAGFSIITGYPTRTR